MRTLDSEELQFFYKKDKSEYMRLMIDHIDSLHEGEDTFYHIAGADSVVKMAKYNKLPAIGSKRIVVAMERSGYKIPKAQFADLLDAGQLKVLNPELGAISSSKIRKGFVKNIKSNQLFKKTSDYVIRNQLYGTTLKLRGLGGALIRAKMDGFNSRFISISERDVSMVPVEIPISKIFNKSILHEKLSLDFDKYFKTHVPAFISMLLNKGIKVTVMAGRTPETLTALGALGYKYAIELKRPMKRIQYEYFLCRKNYKWELVITNVFGASRLKHLVLQYANFHSRNGITLDGFHVFKTRQYDELTSFELKWSLRDLKPTSDKDIVVVGYRGAFNYVLSDLQRYLNHNSDTMAQVKLSAVDQWIDKNGRVLQKPEVQGTGSLTWTAQKLRLKSGEVRNIFAFRNLYGDQTYHALKLLKKKGFKNFILFGNCGGLQPDMKVGAIYAPAFMGLRNDAVGIYAPMRCATVDSVLEETSKWMGYVPDYYDLVDVESWHVNLAWQGVMPKLFYGLLVSDLPGGKDITHKNEDSLDFINAKRDFFLQALKTILNK
jgi:hypothetical protein